MRCLMRFSRSSKPWLGLFAVGPFALGLTLPHSHPTSEAYDLGLHFWRLSGRVDGGAACASCHGPDGLELACYNFDDADILRRARVHLTEEDSREVVNFIHSVREKYGIAKLLDPLQDRPFQPGGNVLPGETSNARDIAFGQELERRLPILFNGRIERVAQAKAAVKELLDLDPWTLKIGFPLSRLSEDVAHGAEHASIDQWLPETPPTISEKDLSTWFAAEDAYLERPSIETLRNLIGLHEQLTFAPVAGIQTISNVKYRALLLLDYRLRTRNMAAPQPPVAEEIVEPGKPNPAWEVGELARDLETQNEQSLGMAGDLAIKKAGPRSTSDQISDLSRSWFWLGWLFDQGMYRTLGGKNVTRGDWLARALWLYGPYPIHNIYSSTRRQLVASFTPGATRGPSDRRHLLWDYAAVRIGNRYISQIPSDPLQKQLYLSFAANCFRMNLLMLQEELQRTHVVWGRPNSLQNVKDLSSFIELADPENKVKDEEMKNHLLVLIGSAEERF
jgi:hypothetical protein